MDASYDSTADARLRRWIQRRERTLAVAWIAFCVALVAFLGLWGLGANGAERLVERVDSSWVRELDALAEQVRAKQFERALPRLEKLDRECPAVFVKHRFDKEREKLLGLLAKCYVELDRRKLARDTLHRLVAFDPRNYDNNFQLARTERAFGDDVAAGEAYARVLAIHPTHLPSVQAVIEMAFAAGAHGEVIAAYERYLDAWLLGTVRVRCGELGVDIDVPVDGREHEVEGLLELPAGWSGEVCLETRGYSAHVASVELVAPLAVGVAAAPEASGARIGGDWRALGGSSNAPAEISASKAESSLCSSGSSTTAVSRVRVRLNLFKALPADVWAQVSASYRNQLDSAAFERASARSRIGGCLAGGSIFLD